MSGVGSRNGRSFGLVELIEISMNKITSHLADGPIPTALPCDHLGILRNVRFITTEKGGFPKYSSGKINEISRMTVGRRDGGELPH